MFRVRPVMAVFVALVIAAVSAAQDAGLVVQTAMGTVDKAAKDSLTIRPRGPDGKFAKNLTLRVTGTSKVTTVALEKRGKKAVPVQRETEPADLQPGQPIAVIYTGGASPVLLSAVAQGAPEKK